MKSAFLEWSAYNMHMSMLMNIMEYLRYVMPAGRDGQAGGLPHKKTEVLVVKKAVWYLIQCLRPPYTSRFFVG